MITRRACIACNRLFYHDGIADREVCLECDAKAAAGPAPGDTRLDFDELLRLGLVGLGANWDDFQRLTLALIQHSRQLEGNDADILSSLCSTTLRSFQISPTLNNKGFFMLSFCAGVAMCMTGISAVAGPGGTPLVAVRVEDRSEDDEG